MPERPTEGRVHSNATESAARPDHACRAFDAAAVAMRLEDLSQVKRALDALRAEGVTDLRAHLIERPELAPELIEAVDRLGYPHYHLTIIGVAKLVGAPLLLVPRLPRLKEWVYAGFAIDFGGAIVAHAFAGDTVQQTLPALFCAALVGVSYATYRMSGPKMPVRVGV